MLTLVIAEKYRFLYLSLNPFYNLLADCPMTVPFRLLPPNICLMKNQLPYILLADDDPDDREALIQPFIRQNPGVRVLCADNGRQLLDFLENCPSTELPVLILMDYKMPILTAAEILEKLAGDIRYAGILKLVWSTSSRAEFVDRCLRHGASHYFTKPNSLHELEKIVDRITRVFRTRLAIG
jgi:CheY-like chemotaxis protein